MNAWKRLRKEKEQLGNGESDKDIMLSCDSVDLLSWKAVILGPSDTPYEGYLFKLMIEVPNEYPLLPPKIRFATKIFHPNIHFKSGEICMDVLKRDWTPAWSLNSACRAILSLLSDPNAESPLNCDAGNMIRAGDMIAFYSMAKMFVIENAVQIPADLLAVEVKA